MPFATGRGLRGVLRGVVLSAVATTLLIAPTPVAAHVSRVVGRYSFLIILIGEPYFPTNRAGFEIWVNDNGRPIGGLERTLRAEAVGAGVDVALGVTAQPDAGHYQAEFDLAGAPFDPKAGGPYLLRLAGSVEDLAINESFPVIFPGYPRVAAAAPGAATVPRQAPVAAPSGPTVAIGLYGLLAAAIIGVSGAALAVLTRRRRVPS